MLVEDAGAQVDQGLLLVTLSDDEEGIGPVHGLDRLNRHLVGITSTDTDHQEFAHVPRLYCRAPLLTAGG